MILFLTGYRGSGKSTIAPLVADLAACDWEDTDQIVESTAGISIAEIFSVSGETEFRRQETEAIIKAIKSCQPRERLVVSLGGGAIIQPANQTLIKQAGLTVYLNGSVDTLWQRINTDPNSGQQRPDLTDQGGRQEVESVMAIRQPTYVANSDWQIDVDELTPDQAAQAIADWWIEQVT
jgi:shikimate kinase